MSSTGPRGVTGYLHGVALIRQGSLYDIASRAGAVVRDLLTDAVREFTHTILNPYDLDDLLDRLIERVTSALRAAGAGIML